MSILSITLAVFFVFVAYFLKGFSGFGPALVIIPAISLLINPETAISVAAFFDIFAGFLLIITVFRQIDWKFVVPVTLLLLIGAYPGAALLKSVSTDMLKLLIGGGIMIFIVVLLSSNHDDDGSPDPGFHWLQYPVALFSGFSGGLIGISGPFMIIYLKLRHRKEYFRTQLIAIFFFGAMWRFYLYRSHGISMDVKVPVLILMGCALALGLYVGQHIHYRVDERRFTRIVALVLILPSVNLVYSALSEMLSAV